MKKLSIQANDNGDTRIELNKVSPSTFKRGFTGVFLFGLVVAVGGWIFGFGEKSAKQEQVQLRIEKHEVRIETVETAVQEIKEDQIEIKTDVKWIRESIENSKGNK